MEVVSETGGLTRESVAAAPIYQEIYGSDHCPVGLELDMEVSA